MSGTLSMRHDSWSEVSRIFGAILDLPSGERETALTKLADKSADTAAKVRKLLDNLEAAKSYFVISGAHGWASEPISVNEVVPSGGVLAGRYENRGLLGKGGMGEVYEVWDRYTEIQVALKLLPPRIAGGPAMAERFLKEVHLAREVGHPGICKTFDLGKHVSAEAPMDAPLLFLTMEFVDGETLAERLATGPVPIDEARSILLEIADAMAAAHLCKVIHRDLKPSNVMLRRTPLASGHRVSVMDFGLARRTGEGAMGITGVSEQVGTPLYMAPEQLRNERVTERADIYAIGLIGYELLVGRKPFAEEPPLAALIKRTTTLPPAPGMLVKKMPAGLNKVVMRCLEPSPAARYANAVELTRALESENRFDFKVRHARPITRRSAIALGGVATAVAGGAWWRATHRAFDARVAAGTPLLLMPTENDTKEPELDGISVAFGEAIRQSARLAFAQPTDEPEQLKLILKDKKSRLEARDARHLALRRRIPLVLFGTLARVGSEYVFHLELEKVGGGTEQAAGSVAATFRAANKREIHTALHEAAAWLRRTTGESDASISDLGKRPEEVTTDSWEALREYSKSEAQRERDLPGAILTLDAATRRDPLFAMAQMRRADYLTRANRFAEGYEAWEKAMAALQKRPTSRREELMIRSMYSDDMQDFGTAVRFYEELATVYPYLEYPRRYMASPLMKLGRIEESIQVAKDYAARTGGTRWAVWRKLLDYAAVGAKFDVARGALEEMKKRNPPPGQIELAMFMLHASTGEAAPAEDAIRGALPKLDQSARSDHTLEYSHWLADRERYDDAAKVLAAGLDVDTSTRRVAERARKLISMAVIGTRTGDRGLVRSRCLDAIELDGGPQRARRAAVVLARHGFERDARRVSELLKPAAGVAVGKVALAVVEGEIMLSRKDPESALRALEPVAKLRSKTESRIEFGRALAGAGRMDEAMRLMDESNRFRNSEWIATDLAIPMDYYDCRFLRQTLGTGLLGFGLTGDGARS